MYCFIGQVDRPRTTVRDRWCLIISCRTIAGEGSAETIKMLNTNFTDSEESSDKEMATLDIEVSESEFSECFQSWTLNLLQALILFQFDLMEDQSQAS